MPCAYRVRVGAQRRPVDRGALLHPVVPQHDLAGVGAAEDQVRVKFGKARRHDRALTVEHLLRRLLLELGVPHHHHTVRLVRCLLVAVVGRHHQLGEVRRPVERRDAPVLRPAIAVEGAVQRQPCV